MKPRKPSPAQKSPVGLIAWLDQTRIALPLKGVECRFTAAGGVASVEIDQIFHADTERALDCTYTFPLPAGAAVHRCEFHINGRVIRAKVEPEARARQLFQQHKAAGHHAALVESDRDNLFTLTLGNVQPGDLIIVRIAWFQVLDRATRLIRLLVPTCPGVRYIPGQPLLRAPRGKGTSDDTDRVPDASRITPPRIDSLHPDAAYFYLEGEVSGFDADIGTISSPTHRVAVQPVKDKATVTLSGRGAVPDRDFVLTWREPKNEALASRGWIWREKEEAFALVQFRAPKVAQPLAEFSHDFYFLVDRSGSMAGANWTAASYALRAFVELLGPQDRVWITLFNTTFRDFDCVPLPAPDVLADAGFTEMPGMDPNGGTELLPAARHLIPIVQQHSKDRRASVVLITDGQVGDDRSILEAFAQLKDVAVHTFGIDAAVNDAFLKSLARQHGGGCWLQTPNDDIVGTIAGLGDRLRRPVLTHLQVPPAWLAATGLPDLHGGEIATIALRGLARDSMPIRALRPDGQPFTLDIPLHPGSEAIKLLWARERIAALEQTDPSAAVDLAVKYNLICKGASFVAWDDEKGIVATEEIVQPSLSEEPGLYSRKPCAAQKLPFPPARAASMRMRHLDEFLEQRESCVRLDGGFDADPALIELRGLCKKLGIKAKAAESLATWAMEGAPDTAARFGKLLTALQLLWLLHSSEMPPVLRTAFEKGFREASSTSPQALLEWVEKHLPLFREARGRWEELGGIVTPAQRERVLDWLVVHDTILPERLAKTGEILSLAIAGPFSARIQSRLWEGIGVEQPT